MVSSQTSSTESAQWDDALLSNPHAVADKRRRVQKMFAAIAPSYDLNNRLHSLWMDQAWRRKAVMLAALKDTDRVVDVACGTGDLTLAMCHGLWPDVGDWPPVRGQVVGIDFTFEMLPIAREKSQISDYKSPISYLNGDAQALPLPDQSADV